MKNRFSILIIVASVSFSIIGVIKVSAKNEFQSNKLKLEVFPVKSVLILGEILTLKFRVTNISQESTPFANCLNFPNSFLRISISKDGGKYRKYSNSIWQRSEKMLIPQMLKVGESIENSVNLIWNYVPNVVNLNEVAKEALVSDFIFTSKGSYVVKVICPKLLGSETIESAPIKIKVKEPVGKDRKIWNLIKGANVYSFFLQEGDIPFRLRENPIFLVEEIKEIIKSYPNSVITQQLRKSVEKFNQKQTARRKSCEGMEGCNPKLPFYDPIKLL